MKKKHTNFFDSVCIDLKYEFPPVKFLHQVVCKIRKKKESILLGCFTERSSITSGGLNLAHLHRVVEFAFLAIQ